jgi:Zn-dependent M28 family amino/carboxypeptidase
VGEGVGEGDGLGVGVGEGEGDDPPPPPPQPASVAPASATAANRAATRASFVQEMGAEVSFMADAEGRRAAVGGPSRVRARRMSRL